VPAGPRGLPSIAFVAENAYLRQPTIAGDLVVVLTEDDLFAVGVDGGVATRITSGLGAASSPVLSPDGTMIAYTGRDEHHAEAWCVPVRGGSARRLTYFGANADVRGWTPDGRVLVVTAAAEPLAANSWAYAQPLDGGPPERLPYGPVRDVAFGPGGQVVLGRMTADPARWKRYRGGTAGQLWIEREGSWQRLVDPGGNLASPMWIGDRIFFLSDHEGVGNLYSCRSDGGDLARHSDHGEYYARFASSDGRRIVYQHAAEIWCYDAETDCTAVIPIEVRGARVQRQRRFVEADRYLGDWALRPDGSGLGLVARGKLFDLPLFEGPVRRLGAAEGAHYRFPAYLDEDHLLVVSDEGGEEHLEILQPSESLPPRSLDSLGVTLGEVACLAVSPTGDSAAVAVSRGDLLLIEIPSGSARVIDRSDHGPLSDLAWSSDGRYLAYTAPVGATISIIKVHDLEDRSSHAVTRPEFKDHTPVFDPDGGYLAFLSSRHLDPVPDEVYFDLSFPRASSPYLVTLTSAQRSPLRPLPRGMGETDPNSATAAGTLGSEAGSPPPVPGDAGSDPGGQSSGKGEPVRVEIEFAGIFDRVQKVPVPEASYHGLAAIKSKLLLLGRPVHGMLDDGHFDDAPAAGTLDSYELAEGRHEVLASAVSRFSLSRDRKTVVYQSGKRLRALLAGAKAPEGSDAEGTGRRSGWLDLGRVRPEVDPAQEWRQMLVETWRLQREHFWVEDLSGVDWQRVLDRYLPLVDRCSTRAELADLIWELQGELGTSHSYEFGGDHRSPPAVLQGSIGADTVWDEEEQGWRISHIVTGDSWSQKGAGALTEPGIEVSEGDVVLGVNGRPVSRVTPPGALLLTEAGRDVELEVRAPGGEPRRVVVTARTDTGRARYRDWVVANTAVVHEASGGRVGYVHVPDMGARGFSEFHRTYLAEVERDGLIVDVRHNGGGNVSSLLLAKLAARRLGYDVSRWLPTTPYPEASPAGPLVAISDAWAGSDGDIFTHAFRQLGLGPVVGTRTWGGVIGISPRRHLADGSIVTQPEFSFWFSDVGWAVENYGVDPDVEVEILPDDYAAGRDPQLDKAVELALAACDEAPRVRPDMSRRPRLGLPSLPPRTARGS
jgi:tricorn protease